MPFSPVQKLSIGIGVSLVVLGMVGLVSYASLSQLMGGQRAVASTNNNISRLDRVIARTLDGENAERGFVSTGDSAYLAPLNDAQSDVEFGLDSLRAATEDNPAQRRTLDSLAPMLSSRFRDIRGAVAMRQRFGADSARLVLRREKSLRDAAGAGSLANRMRDEELRVLGERTRTLTASGTTASRVILAGALLALALSFVALQPLRPSVAEQLQRRLALVRRASSPGLTLTVTDEARHAGDRLQRLQQVIAALSEMVPASDVALALLTRGAPPLVGSLGIVALADNGQLRVLRALGDAVRHLEAGAIIPSSLAAPFTEAMRSRKPVFVESRIERLTRFPSLGRFSETGTSDGAFAATPLTGGDAVLGVLLIAFADNRGFSEDDRAYIDTLGRLGGQALARNGLEARR